MTRRERMAARISGSDRTSVVGVALALVPFAAAAARAVRNGWFPIGDSALLYIRAADTFTTHHPWLGSWTSASQSVGRDMNNPGAMYDWLLSPFARLLPPGPGAAIGVATINALCVIGIAVAARHVGGRSLERVMVLATALLAWSMGSELLIDIWQAHALLLPFVLLLVLLIGVAARRDRCLPWAVAVASLLVQTHISYAYVLVLLALAVALLRWMAVPPADQEGARHPFIAATVVAGVLWLPSILEQLFGEGEGNLTRLVKSAGGGDLTLGVGNALGAVAAVFVRPWWWLRRGFSTTVPSTPVAVEDGVRRITLVGLPSPVVAAASIALLVVALMVAAVWCRRAGRHVAAAGAALAAVLPVAAVVCLAVLTVGPVGLAAHHVRWIWASAVVVHGVTAWCAWHVVGGIVVRRVPERAGALAWIGVVGLVALASLPVVAHPEGPTVDRGVNPVLAEVFDALGPLEGVGPVRYDTDTLRMFEPYSSAVMMEMQARGIEFRVSNEGMVRQLGNGRRATGDEAVTVFQLEGIDAIRYAGEACVLASAGLISSAERAAAEEMAELLESMIIEGVIVLDGAAALSVADREVLEGAALGDEAAVDALVYRGVLGRAVAVHAIELVDASGVVLADAAALVDRWVGGHFALLATPAPADCPVATAAP